MAQFHPLTVTDVRNTTADAVVVTFEQPQQGFDFEHGQYLTFRRDFDGTELRRCYSICAAQGTGVLQVGIKRVDGGAFSTWANETLAPGMTLEAMPPMGQFTAPLQEQAARHYLGVAGGSGITPVLSILRTVLKSEPLSRFTLIYANRGVASIMFREELEDLKNQYMGRLSVLHILETGAQDVDLFQGRVDGEKCDALFAHWLDVADLDLAFICGPQPMMLGVSAALERHGLDKSRIKMELFKSGQPGRLPRVAVQDANPNRAEATTRVTLTLDGVAREFTMARDTSLLQAALDNSIDVPFACRAGVCSTCKCRVTKGGLQMVANHALEDYEVAQGYRLSCQSLPTSEQIKVVFEH